MNSRADHFDNTALYRQYSHADTTPSHFHDDQPPTTTAPTTAATTAAAPPPPRLHEMASESSFYEHDDLPFAVSTTTTDAAPESQCTDRRHHCGSVTFALTDPSFKATSALQPPPQLAHSSYLSTSHSDHSSSSSSSCTSTTAAGAPSNCATRDTVSSSSRFQAATTSASAAVAVVEHSTTDLLSFSSSSLYLDAAASLLDTTTLTAASTSHSTTTTQIQQYTPTTQPPLDKCPSSRINNSTTTTNTAIPNLTHPNNQTVHKSTAFSWLLQQADNRQPLESPRPSIQSSDATAVSSIAAAAATAAPVPRRTMQQHTSLHSNEPLNFQNPIEYDDPEGSSFLILSASPETTRSTTMHLQRRHLRRAPSPPPPPPASMMGVTAAATSANSFVVTLDIPVTLTTTTSMGSSNSASLASSSSMTAAAAVAAAAQDAMDDIVHVLSSTECLPLWCDAIPRNASIIIVQSSEGARPTGRPRRMSEQAGVRQYEGEWVEAVVTASLTPPAPSSSRRCCSSAILGAWQSSCRSWSSTLAACAGFPCHGKVTLFVERPVQKVSLTLGPLAGNVQVCHSFTVTPIVCPKAPRLRDGSAGSSTWNRHDNNGVAESVVKIRIVDTVRLLPYSDRNGDANTVSCCGLWSDASWSCGVPLQDYMDQTVSSLVRLRFLVEEQPRWEPATVTAMRPNGTQSQSYSPLLVGGSRQ
jgi:hypothetical protein